MKSNPFVIGSLVVNSLLCLYTGNSLYSRCEVYLDKETKQVYPIGHADSNWFFTIAGVVGGGAIAYSFIKKDEVQTKALLSEPILTNIPSNVIPFQQTSIIAKKDANAWYQNLKGYPCILVFGGQGAGKTTFIEMLVSDRIKDNHQILILDPHRHFGQWEGLEVVGDGMDYQAIDDAMAFITQEIEKRYTQLSKDADYEPQKLTVIAEEFTNWSSRCKSSGEFFFAAMSDIRKVGIHVIFVSHARTMTALGNAKGMAAARDSSLLELELLSQVNPETGKASPKFEGKLKLPGCDWETVKIPKIKQKIGA